MTSCCDLKFQDLKDAMAGDALLDEKFQCRICGKLAGLHPKGGSITTFMQLLKRAGVDPPKPKVLQKIRSSFAIELYASIDSVTSALRFYSRIQAIPSTTTKAIISSQLHIALRSPLSLENPALHYAIAEDGRHLVAKLFYIGMDRVMSAIQEEVTVSEVKCCEDLGLSVQLSSEVALVSCEVARVTAPPDSEARVWKELRILLMPRYIASLEHSMSLNKMVLAREGRRMVTALHFIHSRGYVHMDVKAENIFVDVSGEWFLGDFGSACKVNDIVTSTTEVFYYETIIGKPAEYKYDWFMLLVTLLRGLDVRREWMETFVKGGHVNQALIKQETERILSDEENYEENFRDLIADVAFLACLGQI